MTKRAGNPLCENTRAISSASCPTTTITSSMPAAWKVRTMRVRKVSAPSSGSEAFARPIRDDRPAAIVLAAGRSSRMGRAKASLPLDGADTFLTRIVRTFHAAGIDDVIVVVGHEADEIARVFSQSGLPARFVMNANYDRGQLSSLVAGLAAIDRPG